MDELGLEDNDRNDIIFKNIKTMQIDEENSNFWLPYTNTINNFIGW